MSVLYFIRRGKTIIGPSTLEKIKANIVKGNILASDAVSQKQDGPWQILSDVPELARLLSGEQPITVEEKTEQPVAEVEAVLTTEILVEEQRDDRTLYNDGGITINREFFKFTNADGLIESFAIRNISGHAINIERWDRSIWRVVGCIFALIVLIILANAGMAVIHGQWTQFLGLAAFGAVLVGFGYLIYKYNYLKLFDKYHLTLQTNAGPSNTIWSKKQSDISEITFALEEAMKQHG